MLLLGLYTRLAVACDVLLLIAMYSHDGMWCLCFGVWVCVFSSCADDRRMPTHCQPCIHSFEPFVVQVSFSQPCVYMLVLSGVCLCILRSWCCYGHTRAHVTVLLSWVMCMLAVVCALWFEWIRCARVSVALLDFALPFCACPFVCLIVCVCVCVCVCVACRRELPRIQLLLM